MSERLPQDAKEWGNEAQSLQLNTKSIHECDFVPSASKIGWEQFLLLRIVWPRPHPPKQLYSQHKRLWITNDRYFEQAHSFFASGEMGKAWNRYLDAIPMPPSQLNQRGYAGLHTFSLVRYHQIQSQALEFGEGEPVIKLAFTPIARRTRAQLATRNETPTTPTPASRTAHLENSMAIFGLGNTPGTPRSTPSRRSSSSARHTPAGQGDTFSSLQEEIAKQLKAIQDEQIVNTALILYLDSLIIHCAELEADWTLHRLPLISRDNVGNKTYEARVDGYLKRRRDGAPLAILEVKPYLRHFKGTEIRMQEGAQMAAWISHHPPHNIDSIRVKRAEYRRLLISQDRHEIYLTFAKFDAVYVDYICHKNQANANNVMSYLTMFEYGPFDVGDSVAMTMLGELVLGYALEVCHME